MIKFLNFFIQWIMIETWWYVNTLWVLQYNPIPNWHAMHYFPLKQKYKSVVILMEIKIIFESLAVVIF
jgi:hypothetical protein